ncbi:hypothetical protein ACSI5N_25235 (plasmid) [Raoultella ornithinolytica]|uniref:hypothetical protein n=1 Tax=Raoultella ornithinolytica TaxID=54291 RepID=UPI00292C1D5B|nr:hypothetical protein [Raoultella ornithinolytica]MDV1094929.1 hypothetical protein [Raoultella ornithinolytica]MDV1122727.1 hypothetical protein [Raoultella ornithinolytica]MDV1893242.1 hypothetical protein [Raoultella ornithinolytica]
MNNSTHSDYFNGFGLEKVIRCCPLLTQTHCNIISAMGNLAASTDLYIFKNSYPYIARMTNTSEGTVRRAIAAAIKQGIVIKTRTFDAAHMNSCNCYQFSRAFLDKVRDIAIACKEKAVSIVNESPRLRTIAKMVFSGLSIQQFRSDHRDQSRSDHPDRTKDKKTKPPVKRIKKQCPDKPAAIPAEQSKLSEEQGDGVPAVSEKDVFNELAAAKSRADKKRADKRYAAKKALHKQAEKLAKKFAWLKGAPDRKRPPLPVVSNFDGLPMVQTVSEAMEQLKQQGYTSEFDRKDWNIPSGFRGA